MYADRAEGVLLGLRRTTPQLALPVTAARELAQIAGHYPLRQEGPETIRAVVVQGLPPEGVRSPKGFVRSRLLRYLPPLPNWPTPTPPATATAPRPAAQPPRPDGPVHVLRQGGGWRAALRAAQPD